MLKSIPACLILPGATLAACAAAVSAACPPRSTPASVTVCTNTTYNVQGLPYRTEGDSGPTVPPSLWEMQLPSTPGAWTALTPGTNLAPALVTAPDGAPLFGLVRYQSSGNTEVWEVLEAGEGVRVRGSWAPGTNGSPCPTERYYTTPITLHRVVCCSMADVGSRGGSEGPDGRLDNNDFIVFIRFFFANDPRADIGACGGGAGHDQLWDNSDFVTFIDFFFTTPPC